MPVFEESFRVDAPPTAVWRVLDDPARLAACVPGCDEVVAEGADRFRVRLRVKVGPISTTQGLQLTVTERQSPVRLAAAGQGEDHSLASRVSLRTAIDLREAAGGSSRSRGSGRTGPCTGSSRPSSPRAPCSVGSAPRACCWPPPGS